MKNAILLTILSILAMGASGHDLKMAQFTIHVVDGQLICDGRIDREDLVTALGAAYSTEEVRQYLRKHLTLIFDEVEVAFNSMEVETSRNWVSVHIRLATENHHPSRIEVSNTVLIQQVEDQDNIMRFILHDKARTFRFDESRQMISFNYKTN